MPGERCAARVIPSVPVGDVCPEVPIRKPRKPVAGKVFRFAPGIEPRAFLDRLAAELPCRRSASRPERRVLLDTFDGRLADGQCTLAAQPEDGSTLLRLARVDTTRECEARAAMPPAFARDLPGTLAASLAPLIESRRLFAVVDAEIRTSRLTILDRRHAALLRLTLVESVAHKLPIHGFPSPLDGLPTVLPALLAMAPVPGRERAAARLLRDLASRPGLLPADLNPRAVSRAAWRVAARAAIPAGAAPPAADLHAELPAAEAMRRVHRVLLATIRLNERGVRLDLDDEFLHELRVAVRRTRSLLGQVKRVFQPVHIEHWREEFSWLGRLTGPVRDLDVFLLRLADPQLVPPEDAAALAPLVERLRQRRAAELGRLVAQLDTPRFTTLLAGWADFLEREDPATGRGKAADRAEKPIVRVAGRRIDRLHARFVKRGSSLRGDSPAEDLHALRIEAKKMRYVLDSTRAAFDPATIAALLPPLKLVQAALGDAQDGHVQRELVQHAALELVASGGVSAESLPAFARLDACLAAQAELARIRFSQCLPTLLDERLRATIRGLWRAAAAPGTPVAPDAATAPEHPSVSDPIRPAFPAEQAAARADGR